MKKNKLTAVFFMAFCLFFNAFAQTKSVPKGSELSDFIFSTLSSNKFTPYFQDLTPTGPDSFAKNVYLEFQNPDIQKQDKESKTTAILDFNQEDFFSYNDEFLSFLNRIKSEIESSKINCNVSVLFSALNNPSVPPFSRISGSKIFAENFLSPDEAFAITVNFENSNKNTIRTGSLHSTTPLWLCEKLARAFSDSDENFSFPNRISSLYRLGFIHGEKKMNDFIMNEIPAVSVSFSSSESGLKIITNFLENYFSDGTENWDKHYIFLPLWKNMNFIILNETICLGICMALAIVTILVLCVLSFIGKQGEQNKYDLLKNIYMIPLTIAVSILGLSVSQFFLKKITGNFITNPVMIFGIKIIIAMFFISLFYALHNILKLPTDIFIYSYIIQFIALFNIFFFALRDLMLFVPFGIEYIIIFIFRKRKSLANLIIFFLIMTLPFVPYAIDILQKANQEDFPKLIYTNFWGNFSVSLALFPFQILWLKILIKLDIYNKQKKYPAWKLLRNGFISTASIFAFCFAAMQTIYILVFKPVKIAEEKSKILIEDDFSEFCSMKISKNEFSGMNTNHIKISSKKNALRYIVTVTSLDYKVPVYDSIYAYDFTSEKADDGNTIEKVSFIIPDYPPKEMTIDYAASPDSFAEIKVDSFYADENDKIDGKNGNKVILHEKTTALIGTKK